MRSGYWTPHLLPPPPSNKPIEGDGIQNSIQKYKLSNDLQVPLNVFTVETGSEPTPGTAMGPGAVEEEAA